MSRVPVMQAVVDIHYDDHGSDNVKIMEAYGRSSRTAARPPMRQEGRQRS